MVQFSVGYLNKSYNKLLKSMSDSDEGFAVQQTTQLIEFNYQPSSRAWTTLAKKLRPVNKKQNPLTLLTCSSRLINNSIHSQWVDSLWTIKKPKNIVFNASAKECETYQEQNVIFHSQFESGNMQIIARKKQNEYDMYMKPDSNTKNHFQWFYFKLKIKRGNRKIKFTIKNFIKSTMLYSKGLKPYCKSLKNPDFHEYKQIQEQVKFYEDVDTGYFCLQFSFFFDQDDDEAEFCSQPPYTFTQLNKLITPLKCKKLTLGKTMMGSKIPYLIFQAKKQTKSVVVAIARQHPGESVSSWMMEGFINQLSEGKYNDFITYYVVPMVNIDGVVLGNNRTGVLGHDFNRNWDYDEMAALKTSKLFPQIQSIVSLLKNLKRKFPRKVKMFLDLHGHSSQPNVFTYGPPHEQQSQYFYQCRLFPELISKRNPLFKLSQCSYVLNPQKKKTARSIVFKNLGIPFTYTIESTFGVFNDKSAVVDNFIKVGEDIAVCAYEFINTTVIRQNCQGNSNIIQQLKQKYATAKNEGEQYDSASEASDQNPNRIKIQQMIIANQQSLNKIQNNSRYIGSQTESSEEIRKSKSLMKSIDEQQKQICRRSFSKKTQKRRVQTEVDILVSRKDCLFPNIATRNNKLSFDQINGTSNQQIIQNLKIDYIQKRLHKLRHSKIGKKILVINAYCS